MKKFQVVVIVLTTVLSAGSSSCIIEEQPPSEPILSPIGTSKTLNCGVNRNRKCMQTWNISVGDFKNKSTRVRQFSARLPEYGIHVPNSALYESQLVFNGKVEVEATVQCIAYDNINSDIIGNLVEVKIYGKRFHLMCRCRIWDTITQKQ